ncbi:MAG: ATP-binding protein [Pseudomonadota bacterium]
MSTASRGPSIRWLLVGANAAVLALPLAAVLTLRLYDVYLLRQTERQLIAQGVVLGEAFRQAWLEENDHSDAALAIRPPERAQQRWVPYEPVIGAFSPLAEPESAALPAAQNVDSAARRAGQRVQLLLQRSQVFTLTAARILDHRGCTVATTGGDAGRCLTSLPEVQRALAGTYTAVKRRRVVGDTPPLGDLRRRGDIRVYTALPLFVDGQVIAVVRMSRTSMDALSSLWLSRRGFLSVGIVVVLAVLGIGLLFATAIARPLRRLTVRARAITGGAPEQVLAVDGWAPAEVRVLAQALDTMTRRLAERGTELVQFAATASHELKSPITSIRGAAELLRDGWQDMDETQRTRFVDNILHDSERMERLVNRLLELTRIESATPDSGIHAVDVSHIVNSLRQRYGEAVQWDLRDTPIHLDILPDHLVSVLCNLIDNALRHAADQPVQVTLRGEGQHLHLEVRDHGAGISLANQTRLFQRFFTTARDQGGTGLGLAIVKAIADARGGRIEYHPEQPGSRFTVLL